MDRSSKGECISLVSLIEFEASLFNLILMLGQRARVDTSLFWSLFPFLNLWKSLRIIYVNPVLEKYDSMPLINKYAVK